MRDAVTTALEVAGLALVAVAVFLAAPLWAGLLAVGAEMVAVGVLAGRR